MPKTLCDYVAIYLLILYGIIIHTYIVIRDLLKNE